MRFNLKKQPGKLADRFRALPISELEAHKLLPGTVYLYLEANQKFLAVKEPLDFFTEAELEKYSKLGTLHVPEHFDIADRFREAGHTVRSMLEWTGGEGEELEPSSFEMSDAIIRQMASLWAPLDPTRNDNAAIETFFAVIFAHEIVDPVPNEWLDDARAKDLDLYLISIMRAALSVFIALHLGFGDRAKLNELYTWVFATSANLSAPNNTSVSPQMKELGDWVSSFIVSPEITLLESGIFNVKAGRVPEKLKSRLKRICKELMSKDARLQSVHAEPWTAGNDSEVRDAA